MTSKYSLPKACECLAEYSLEDLMLTQPRERQEGVFGCMSGPGAM